MRGGNEGRVGDVERGVRGVAVEARVGHGVEAAVPADDVEDGALGADAGRQGVQPTGGGRVGSAVGNVLKGCLLYTSPSPRDLSTSRMPSSA